MVRNLCETLCVLRVLLGSKMFEEFNIHIYFTFAIFDICLVSYIYKLLFVDFAKLRFIMKV